MASATTTSYHVAGPIGVQANLGVNSAYVVLGWCRDGADVKITPIRHEIKFDGAGGPEGGAADFSDTEDWRSDSWLAAPKRNAVGRMQLLLHRPAGALAETRIGAIANLDVLLDAAGMNKLAAEDERKAKVIELRDAGRSLDAPPVGIAPPVIIWRRCNTWIQRLWPASICPRFPANNTPASTANGAKNSSTS